MTSVNNTMTAEDIIAIIQKHSLTVRCLPHEVTTYWTYREGDENKHYVDEKGNKIEAKREVVVQDFDLEHFQKTKPQKWCTDSPEKRFANWKKNNPNGRKLLKETKPVQKAGWWYVQHTPHTSSTIQFGNKYNSSEFLAPTLEEAIQLFLDSKV